MLSTHRVIALAGGMVLLFAVTVALLLKLIPGPHRDIDYLVVGGVATLICLLALFIVLIATIFRAPDTFFRKRPAAEKKPEDRADERPPTP